MIIVLDLVCLIESKRILVGMVRKSSALIKINTIKKA